MYQVNKESMLLKMQALRRGERIISNNYEMDAMMDVDGDLMVNVRSTPNPKQVGTLDQYVAWLDLGHLQGQG